MWHKEHAHGAAGKAGVCTCQLPVHRELTKAMLRDMKMREQALGTVESALLPPQVDTDHLHRPHTHIPQTSSEQLETAALPLGEPAVLGRSGARQKRQTEAELREPRAIRSCLVCHLLPAATQKLVRNKGWTCGTRDPFPASSQARPHFPE